MSVSPPVRRYSSTTSSSREDLINQYEAEEERIINVLSRKLERLREEKIALENTLEAESESHVNRLSREISALRLAQQQQQAQVNGGTMGSGSGSPVDTRLGLHTFLGYRNPAEPSSEMMLEAMRRENEQLRSRLVDTERDYMRITRLNEIYREELIEHRRRLGLPVDNLIGLASAEPYSQPTHRRASSAASSPATSIGVLASPSPQRQHPLTAAAAWPIPGVPIPRPPSQVHHPAASLSLESSAATTPLSHSPSSPTVFSTSVSPLASYATGITTPPSSAPLVAHPPAPYPAPPPPLSYPSVPPPSLSSSFGSPPPMMGEHFMGRGHSRGASHSRRTSVERGARVAETGSLLPRGRVARGSLQGMPEVETTAAVNGSSRSGHGHVQQRLS
ncbi:hypothetical protein IEO21_02985 [Rhodonia placenta]|uniref:Uncharacterized protein n=1 Tax=Rhodonia placenta TaxID=104341 RepID=A0A8H7P6G6_9APHY|nr:hypothetical protein IEO21_02985 [Postia placenta]